MPAPLSATVRRRLIVAAAIVLLLPFLPVPRFEFVPVAHAMAAELTPDRQVDREELGELRRASDEPIDPDRTISVVSESASFSAAGVSFEREPTDPVLVRARSAEGTWSDWHELAVHHDSGPDAGTGESARAAESGVVATEPIWVGDAVDLEVSLAAVDADGAAATVVRESRRRVVADAVPLADAATSAPTIHSRTSWGARPAKSNPRIASRLNLAVVHHTVSTNSYSAGQVPAILRSVQAFHMDSRNWDDIGYNFLVDRFGRVWEGRGGGIRNPVVGAHAAGFNTGSTGVSLIGNFEHVAAPAAMIEAASQVIGWKLNLAQADPMGSVQVTSGGSTKFPEGRVVNLPRVVGHQDVGATSCPGTVYGRLASIRARASVHFRAYEALWNPFGHVDSVVAGEDRRVTMRGWVKDPDVDDPVVVHAVIADKWHVTTADRPRPDVAAVFPGYGSTRGFEVVSGELEPGTYTACAYGLNVDRGTGNALIGCRQVIVK